MKKTFFVAMAFALAIGSAFTTNAKFDQTTGFIPGSCSTSQSIENVSGQQTCNTTSSQVECTISGVQAYDNTDDCNAGGSTGLLFRH